MRVLTHCDAKHPENVLDANIVKLPASHAVSHVSTHPTRRTHPADATSTPTSHAVSLKSGQLMPAWKVSSLGIPYASDPLFPSHRPAQPSSICKSQDSWKSSQMPAHYAKAELAERGAIARFTDRVSTQLEHQLKGWIELPRCVD